MLLRMPKQISNKDFHHTDKIQMLRQALEQAETIVIGAGAGLSTAAEFVYTGERFQTYFGDFASKYHFKDMYSGGFFHMKP